MLSVCRMALEEGRESRKASWRKFETVNRNEKKKDPVTRVQRKEL